jgi:hypothetical protein
VLYRDTVAPTGDFLSTEYCVAFDDGLEIDRVVHEDAVKAKVVDMYCVVIGAFEDYRLRGRAAGAAQNKDYVHNYYYNKPI